MITSATTGGGAIEQLAVDAAAGTLSTGGDTSTLAPNGTCRYTIATPDGNSDLVVSGSGVLVARSVSDSTTNHLLSVAVPQQTHTLAEMPATGT